MYNRRRFLIYFMESKVFFVDQFFNKGSYKYNLGDYKYNREGIGDIGEEIVEQKRRFSY